MQFISEDNKTLTEQKMQVNCKNIVAIPQDNSYNICRVYMIQSSQEFKGEFTGEMNDHTTYLLFDDINILSGIGINLRIVLNTLFSSMLVMLIFGVIMFKKCDWWIASLTPVKYLIGLIICFVTFSYFKRMYFPYDGLSYFGDAGVYYNLGNSYVKDGKFSLRNYLHTEADYGWMFRGYFLPLFIKILKLPGNFINASDLFYDINSCLFFSAFFTVGIPKLFSLLFKVGVNLIQIIALPFLMIAFWRGVLFYPFSDLYGTIFSIYSLLFFAYFINNNKKSIYYLMEFVWQLHMK